MSVTGYKCPAAQDRELCQHPVVLPALQPGGGPLHPLLSSTEAQARALREPPQFGEKRDGRTSVDALHEEKLEQL